jgi:hypothetical protein
MHKRKSKVQRLVLCIFCHAKSESSDRQVDLLQALNILIRCDPGGVQSYHFLTGHNIRISGKRGVNALFPINTFMRHMIVFLRRETAGFFTPENQLREIPHIPD